MAEKEYNISVDPVPENRFGSPYQPPTEPYGAEHQPLAENQYGVENKPVDESELRLRRMLIRDMVNILFTLPTLILMRYHARNHNPYLPLWLLCLHIFSIVSSIEFNSQTQELPVSPTDVQINCLVTDAPLPELRTPSSCFETYEPYPDLNPLRYRPRYSSLHSCYLSSHTQPSRPRSPDPSPLVHSYKTLANHNGHHHLGHNSDHQCLGSYLLRSFAEL